MNRRSSPPLRGGFSLVELLVIIAILVVLMALLLPAIQQTREAANRMRCSNNMKQIILAVHDYHNDYGFFPPFRFYDNHPPYSFWYNILPYIDEKSLKEAMPTNPFTLAYDKKISTFLCPTRRKPGLSVARVDYTGFRDEPGAIYSASLLFNTTNCPQSICGPNVGQTYRLGVIANRDGTSNTIVMAHKGMDVKSAMGERVSLSLGHDARWTGATSYGHQASITWAGRYSYPPQLDWDDPTDYDTTGCSPYSNNAHHQGQGNCWSSNQLTGSPHLVSMPVFMADGSVRPLRYGTPQTEYQKLINWNDSLTIDPLFFADN